MNCRNFLAEFEERRALTEAARHHLNNCPDCVKASTKQMRVWQMIDGLRRVDAPSDFDFRVKARIAKAKATDFQPRFFPALRYVLPLGLVVLILGLVVFNATYFSGSNSSQMVESVSPMPNEKEISPVNSFSANQVSATNPSDGTMVGKVANVNVEPVANNRERQSVTAKSSAKSRTIAPKKNSDEDGGGSHVLSGKAPSSARLPLGINPNQSVEILPNADNRNAITDVQILNFIGIETVSENGSKKVKAVKPESMAERSGIKTGDVIEAIDGRQISDKPVRMETFESKKLTVVRGAEKIEIVLQNKSN